MKIVLKKNGVSFYFWRDFKEYHTDSTVKFVVKMTPEKLAAAEEQGLHKVFKLQSNISTNSMVKLTDTLLNNSELVQ